MVQIKIVFSLKMCLIWQHLTKDGNNTKCNLCAILDEEPITSAKVTTGPMTKYI